MTSPPVQQQLSKVSRKGVTYVVNETRINEMDITFATKKLQKQLSEETAMVKAHGPARAKKLKLALARLDAAPSLATFAPPMSPPDRCHELKGNRQGLLTVDLDHPYRLVFRVNQDPLPQRPEGGLDWSKVTKIQIVNIEDTHG
jgi:proteic killer suppression protein